MSEPYLILHKVRGAPAFDIAERHDMETNEIWIIPTSGHRAYPSWTKPLSELGIVSLPDTNIGWGYDPETGTIEGLVILPSYPDHYTINDALSTKPKPVVRRDPSITTNDFLV